MPWRDIIPLNEWLENGSLQVPIQENVNYHVFFFFFSIPRVFSLKRMVQEAAERGIHPFEMFRVLEVANLNQGYLLLFFLPVTVTLERLRFEIIWCSSWLIECIYRNIAEFGSISLTNSCKSEIFWELETFTNFTSGSDLWKHHYMMCNKLIQSIASFHSLALQLCSQADPHLFIWFDT